MDRVEKGVPVDKPPAYGEAVATGVPVGQPVQVDAFGRPVVTAVPAAAGFGAGPGLQAPPMVSRVPNNANVRRDAQGNALCNRCAAPYPLPAGCTSWRCVELGGRLQEWIGLINSTLGI